MEIGGSWWTQALLVAQSTTWTTYDYLNYKTITVNNQQSEVVWASKRLTLRLAENFVLLHKVCHSVDLLTPL